LPDEVLRVRVTAIQSHAAFVDGCQTATFQWLDDVFDTWVSAWLFEQVSLACGHASAGQL
jgi:hypothetical protein